MSHLINARRHRLIGTTLAGIGLMDLGLGGFAHTRSGSAPRPWFSFSPFGSIFRGIERRSPLANPYAMPRSRCT
ncbi:hydrolase, alpha/beta fold family domain protein [Burkholderia thailandensis MSMB121]|nr:hydrolase, alpha/beta fold family domain protein [Burkholderia thailandensis MSMB121]AJY39340.1 alpha/beta hydrolase family domain protein [Burkholderia sp. 2002721687]